MSENTEDIKMVDAVNDERELFGGAIVLRLPTRFEDMSKVRQIPDDQEVYLDSAVDQSLIVSLLEHQSQVSNGESAEFFFGDIKDNTGAFEASAESPVELKDEVPHIKEEKSYKCLISGEMTISKFKEGREAANLVHVLLAVIRLPSVETDITLTLYTPIKVSERSSSKVDRTISKEESVAIFKQVLSSFEIRDYSLFG